MRRNSVLVLLASAVLALAAIWDLQPLRARQASASSGSAAQAGSKPAQAGLGGVGPEVHGTPDDPLRDPRESHLRHVKQLTFGGQNAEAYFSRDGKRLIFQSTRPPYECDQMFTM